jgi:hypothetical protein
METICDCTTTCTCLSDKAVYLKDQQVKKYREGLKRSRTSILREVREERLVMFTLFVTFMLISIAYDLV